MARKREKRIRRVVMTSKVAAQWLDDRSEPEYRFRVFVATVYDASRFTQTLRMFRDRKASTIPVEPIEDLGVKPQGDSIHLWSKDKQGMLALQAWFEGRGYETAGVIF